MQFACAATLAMVIEEDPKVCGEVEDGQGISALVNMLSTGGNQGKKVDLVPAYLLHPPINSSGLHCEVFDCFLIYIFDNRIHTIQHGVQPSKGMRHTSSNSAQSAQDTDNHLSLPESQLAFSVKAMSVSSDSSQLLSLASS